MIAAARTPRPITSPTTIPTRPAGSGMRSNQSPPPPRAQPAPGHPPRPAGREGGGAPPVPRRPRSPPSRAGSARPRRAPRSRQMGGQQAALQRDRDLALAGEAGGVLDGDGGPDG